MLNSQLSKYVILRHELAARHSRESHWDLMLEDGDSLLTWALPAIDAAGCCVEAERLPDHRKLYLEYEGPVWNDRGYVRRWDQGEFEWIERLQHHFVIGLRGHRLVGTACLSRPTADQGWRFTFEPKPSAKRQRN